MSGFAKSLPNFVPNMAKNKYRVIQDKLFQNDFDIEFDIEMATNGNNTP